MHANTGQLGGDLNDGTIVMAQGALDLQDKVVKDAMVSHRCKQSSMILHLAKKELI